MRRRQARDNARRIALGFATFALAPLLVGCGIGSARKDPLELEARQLQTEKAELMQELEQCKAKIVQLVEQIKALSAIPGDKRLDPYKLTAVRVR